MHESKHKIWAKNFLRLGLAFVFIWAGAKTLLEPTNWIGFIPDAIASLAPFPKEVLLKIHGFFDLGLALWLLTGRGLKFSAAVSAVTLFGIVAVSGLDDVLFRDIGLITSAAALFLLSQSEDKSGQSLVG